MFENLFQNLLVLAVLFAIFVLAYCKLTGKTLSELLVELKNGFKRKEE
jgi:hypothetical protein